MSFDVSMGRDGILRVTLSGELDSSLTERLRRQITPFADASTPEQPLKQMVTFQQVDRITPEMRRYLTSLHRDPRIGKTAYLQPPRQARVLAQFIHKASGRETIVPFDQESDALTWLQNHQG